MVAGAKPLTQVLIDWGQGRAEALDELMPIVYQELRRLARRYLRGERVGHTLQATALVHEAYLRLVDQQAIPWQSRAHLFALAAQMMRRILVSHARDRKRLKRGGVQTRVTLDNVVDSASARAIDLVALDDALRALATRDEQQSRIIELRYFGGLTIAEAAAVLDVSPATVKNKWTLARAWLHRELRQRDQNGN
jgi:RNA polymerase sigma factor (TIGR02999 family)